MCVATVESTTLATVCYDEAQELLQLEFCSRAVYLYFGVPPAVHQALLDAPSKGRYWRKAPASESKSIARHRQFRASRTATPIAQNSFPAAASVR